MNRHGNMRDALCRELRRFPQVQATIEPRVENPQGRQTNGGEEYAATKSPRYADQHNFVPFIVETGGRVNCAGIDVLSGVAGLANRPLCWWMVGHRDSGR